MKLYFKSLKLSLASELEYKWSFVLSFITQFMLFFVSYFVIVALFSKFGNIKGYTLYEVLFIFSIIQIGFNINTVFFAGIDKFDSYILNGGFDRILLKPKKILHLILCSEFRFSKSAKLIQSIIFLIYSLIKLKLNINLYMWFIIGIMIIGSVLIFLGIFILNAALCFYTIEGLEIGHTATYGSREAAQYPIDIYGKKGLMFFTFILPFGLVNYYPMLYLFGKSNNVLYGLTPIIIVMFLYITILIFNRSSRRYLSTGS